MSARLILGTAQFGLDYGIVNTAGKVASAEVRSMLDLVRRSGFAGLDTAAAYGDAEQLLGACGVSDLPVVTKVSIDPAMGPEQVGSWVMASVRRSLAALRCKQLDGLLLHAAGDLVGARAKQVHAALVAVRDAGLVRRIGASIYARQDIEPVLSDYPVDLIQLPMSVLDQRAREWLPLLKKRHIAVHVRSVFLQGIVLQQVGLLPAKLAALAPALKEFHQRAMASELTPLEAALAFVRNTPGIEGIVVGATSRAELEQIAKAFAQPARFDAAGLDASSLPEADPRNWKAA